MSLLHITNLASSQRLALTTENSYRNSKTVMDILTSVDEKLSQEVSFGGIAEMPKVLERPRKICYFSEDSLTSPRADDETLICIPGEVKQEYDPRNLTTVPGGDRPSLEYGAGNHSA